MLGLELDSRKASFGHRVCRDIATRLCFPCCFTGRG